MTDVPERPSVFDRLLDACGLASGYLCGLIAVGVTLDVVLRMLGTAGLGWVFDLVEYALFALTMLGAAHVMRLRAHVMVDLFVGALPARPRRAFRLLALGLSILISGSFMLVSASATLGSWRDGAMVFKTFVIPEWVPLALVPLMFLLLTIELARQFRALLLEGGEDGGSARSDAL
jgi:TRAP-type C4-dicarboxylate transport system permease small subunit